VFEQQQRMCENVAFGMIIRALGDAFQGANFRQQNFEQAALIKQLETAAGAALG
jgi:hypothetical protein